jgi:hypothetical protein
VVIQLKAKEDGEWMSAQYSMSCVEQKKLQKEAQKKAVKADRERKAVERRI